MDRPKNRKKLAENIEQYKEAGDFSKNDTIEFLAELTGIFPMSLVYPEIVLNNLDYYQHECPPISDFDATCTKGHFAVPRKINTRKSKNGKWFAIIDLLDTNNILTKIRIWSIDPKEVSKQIIINELYQIKNVQYSDSWGYSQRCLDDIELNPKYKKGNGERKWINNGPNWIRKSTNTEQ
tara:strand:+ start:21 stop:560 length:540 start_codon:yes stop_codon:yes gene_type:complete